MSEFQDLYRREFWELLWSQVYVLFFCRLTIHGLVKSPISPPLSQIPFAGVGGD